VARETASLSLQILLGDCCAVPNKQNIHTLLHEVVASLCMRSVLADVFRCWQKLLTAVPRENSPVETAGGKAIHVGGADLQHDEPEDYTGEEQWHGHALQGPKRA